MLTILEGDALSQLRTLPAQSVHCCVTSPPYWGLRDYGTAEWEGGDDGCDHKKPLSVSDLSTSTLKNWKNGGGSLATTGHQQEPNYREICGKCGAKRIDSQLGLEKTPEEYIAKMVEVFREVRRVLRKDGTLWLNLGDSYCASPAGNITPSGFSQTGGKRDGKLQEYNTAKKEFGGLRPKDLCGIPWRVAFALQADGWWLRSDIIWAKPNPMPESVTDRPTKAHEYLFLLTKSANYFYDAEAIKEKVAYATVIRAGSSNNGATRKDDGSAQWQSGLTPRKQDRYYENISEESGRNKRSVWTVATAPYPESHFATYPPGLIKPCIMAGTSAKGCCAKCGSPWERVQEVTNPLTGKSEVRSQSNEGKASLIGDNMFDHGKRGSFNSGGIVLDKKTIGWQPTCECREITEHEYLYFDPKPCTVLDPFAGSGTTGAVAIELGRKSILIELNPKYVELIRQRCDVTPGLQLA